MNKCILGTPIKIIITVIHIPLKDPIEIRHLVGVFMYYEMHTGVLLLFFVF